MAPSASSNILVLLCILLAIIFAESQHQQLKLTLTHTLSPSHFTSTHHVLKSTCTRSAARHRRLRPRSATQVSLPLSPGSDYTLSLSLGTDPPQTLSVYMDTGSDLVWFPCSPFQCILCDGKYPPGAAAATLNVSASTRVPCQSRACSATHSTDSSSDLCAIAGCPLDSIEMSDCFRFSCPPFYYAYGDGSLVARLHNNSLTMATGSGEPPIMHNFTFGCAHSALAEPVGVAGFGRGELSLPAQLANLSPELGNQFSYCLVTHSFDSTKIRQPSPLILGRASPSGPINNFIYTPMLDNPKYPYFYIVGLEAISVGGLRIPAPKSLSRVDRYGNGGVVVDSGTTFTMLPSKLFNSVVSELDRRVGRFYKRATDIEEKTGLSPCYCCSNGATNMVMAVPTLSLQFAGTGNGSSSGVVLPKRNYFYEFLDGGDGVGKGKRFGCLMVMNGGDEGEDGGGPGATLGNYQQQGFEVVYDLERRRVGFAKRRCASLWDNGDHR
ncbi:putative aspartyl protease [Drosera capensis]